MGRREKGPYVEGKKGERGDIIFQNIKTYNLLIIL